MSFADDIKAFQAKALESMNTSVSTAMGKVFTGTVVLSPSPSNPGNFAKGLLSNQYYPNIGTNFSTELTMALSDTGADSLSRIQNIIAEKPFFGKDNTVTLTNNTPEAFHAERLGWMTSFNPRWKNSPPYAMIATSVQNLKGEYM